jgi:hypothetical protein
VLFKFHQIFPRDRPNTPTTFSSTTTELRANGKPEPADLNHRSPPHPPDRRWIGPTVRACQRGPTKPGLVFEPPQALLFSPCLSHSKRERERPPPESDVSGGGICPHFLRFHLSGIFTCEGPGPCICCCNVTVFSFVFIIDCPIITTLFLYECQNDYVHGCSR